MREMQPSPIPEPPDRPVEVTRLLQQVCRHIVTRLGASSCALSHYDPAAGIVTTWITYAREPERESAKLIEVGESYHLDEYPATRRVLQEQTIVCIQRDDPQADPAERAYMEQAGQQSLLMVPLVVEGNTVGLLELYQRDRPCTFTPEELALAQALADEAALVIEGGHLFEVAWQETRDLAALMGANAMIVSSLDLETILRNLAEQMIRLLAVEDCVFSRWDEEKGTLTAWVTYLRGQVTVWSPEEPGVSEEVANFPLTAHVLGERTPVIVHVDDPQADPAERALLERLSMRSLLMLPVIAYDRVIGLVELRDGRQRRDFTPREIALAQALAGQAAVAIENARLFHEREQRLAELSTLIATGQAISAPLDLDSLLRTVHQQIGRLFEASNFFIALHEEGTDEWTMAYQVERGERQPPTRHKLEAGLTGHIIRTRQPILLRTTAEGTAWMQEHGIPLLGELSKSWMGVPMISANELLGVMAVQNYEQEDLYDEQDLALFSTIATQMANALYNFQLLEQTRRRAREMEALNEVGRAITSVLDQDELLRQIVDITKDRFGYYFSCIALIHEDHLDLRATSMIGDSGRRLPLTETRVELYKGVSLVAEAARTGQPVVVNDVRKDPRYLAVAGLADTRSELDVPIMFQDRVIGVLDVQSDQLNAFGEHEIALVQALVNQAGVAIENARFLAQIQQQVEDLREANEKQRRLWQQVQEMSTPVIPVHDRILVLPLVGALDSERSRRLTERLLHAVRQTRALVILLDITGVPVVDTAVAQALIQTANAARLLGAEVALVGVRAEVAQTLVSLGVSMEGIMTMANLQAGIAYALGRVGLRIVPEELLPKKAPPATAKPGPPH